MTGGTYSTPGTTTFTATNGGEYQITAFGAEGGSTGYASGGKGAEVVGDFMLAAGETLRIVVGGAGNGAGGRDGTGGGGGSFVIETFNGTSSVRTPLLVAGGGGGAAYADFGLAINSGGGGGLATAGGSGAGGAGSPNKGYGGGGGGGYSGGAGGGYYSTTTGYGKAGAAGAAAGSGYTGGAGYRAQLAPQNSTYGNGGIGGGGGGGKYGGGGGGGGFGGGVGGAGANYGGYGGGGGGSLDNGTNPALTAGNQVANSPSAGNGEVVITPLCFLRGTHILTPTGEVLVEDLRVGDIVVTRFGGMQPVKWIGRHSHAATAARQNPALRPVRIAAGALGERLPARDLFVSPGHSVLVDGTLLIARLLVNGVTVTQDRCPPSIDYFHIELDAHDCVIAEGAWAETYADAQRSRERFDNAAEFDALYPDAGPAPDAFTLCAPRPEAGEALATAMASVVARAAAQVSPGKLTGSIDMIEGGWRVHGWAHDAAHPELPVLLEVELEGRVIGQVVACGERDDLRAAGFGDGRCAFRFTAPQRLRPETLATLRIRRATDSHEITMHPVCAAEHGLMPREAARPTLRLVA